MISQRNPSKQFMLAPPDPTPDNGSGGGYTDPFAGDGSGNNYYWNPPGGGNYGTPSTGGGNSYFAPPYGSPNTNDTGGGAGAGGPVYGGPLSGGPVGSPSPMTGNTSNTSNTSNTQNNTSNSVSSNVGLPSTLMNPGLPTGSNQPTGPINIPTQGGSAPLLRPPSLGPSGPVPDYGAASATGTGMPGSPLPKSSPSIQFGSPTPNPTPTQSKAGAVGNAAIGMLGLRRYKALYDAMRGTQRTPPRTADQQAADAYSGTYGQGGYGGQ